MIGNRTITEYDSTWTKRFMAAAILQGAIVTGLTVFLVLIQASFMKPEVSRVMAAGDAITVSPAKRHGIIIKLRNS